MGQPVSGTTTFEDVTYSGPYLLGGFQPRTSLTAFNTDGWNFTIESAAAQNLYINANHIYSYGPPSTSTIAIQGGSSDNQTLSQFDIKPNDGTLFDLNSVKIGVSGRVGNTSSVELIGMLNGLPVTGATVTLVLSNGQLTIFDVSSNTPFQGIDEFDIVDGGSTSSQIYSINVDDINATNFHVPGPVVTVTTIGAGFTAGNNTPSLPVAIDPNLTVADTLSPTLASATVSLTGNFYSSEDVLAFTNNLSTMGNITGSYSNGTLTLTSANGTATLAQWQAALRSVTYTDTQITPNNATRTASFTVTDGGGNTGTTVTQTIAVTPTPQSPVLTVSDGFTTVTNPSVPVAVDTGITLSDRDSETLAGATVSIASNFHAGEDVLSFTNTGGQGNITARYLAGSGTLKLSSAGATATVAQWQSALRAITYTDTSATPNTDPRVISFVVSDGTTGSTAVARTVVTGNSQAPITTKSVVMYRFFDSTTGTHLFTDNVDEKNALTDPNSPSYQPGLKLETNGYSAYSYSASDPNQIVAYRFFDKATGAHFYTASASERDDIMNPASSDYQANYVYEPNSNIYEHRTQQTGDVAVYRLFNTTDGTHFYTSDAAEFAGITTAGSATYRPNMISEGVAFYAPNANAA